MGVVALKNVGFYQVSKLALKEFTIKVKGKNVQTS